MKTEGTGFDIRCEVVKDDPISSCLHSYTHKVFQAPPDIQLYSQLLPHWATPRDGGDVRGGL